MPRLHRCRAAGCGLEADDFGKSSYGSRAIPDSPRLAWLAVLATVVATVLGSFTAQSAADAWPGWRSW